MAQAEDAVEFVVQDANMIQVDRQQLARWVFGNTDGAGNRRRAETALQLRIDLIAAAGPLSETQRRKLELAGRGDIHRFMDQFERLERDTPTGRVRQDVWQDIWRKTQPLQTRFQAGLHGPGSLFQRTIPSALDAEQLARYQETERQRNLKHYRALVQATVAQIDRKIPLTAAQRNKLIELVMDKTEPPATYGQGYYQFQLVLYHMSQIPEEELRPLFLENEWNVLRGMLQQSRGMEHRLRREADLDE